MKAKTIVTIAAVVGAGVLAVVLSLLTSTKDAGNGICPRCKEWRDLHTCRECERVTLCRECWKEVDPYCPHNG
jgi:hypothetical protein